ncbi:FAD-dependent oxidoreductase [Bacillus sp. P2(2020)]|uniref:FAD-dependent oxidoreductase n=2 Tax=Calidifontibacillus erzurumensis TaxID=2741433 RepID=A0A8J8KFS9_9BACI|nr:FAD-dependent oxidoreductase [Calidifontibacillus erzurumensis]
MIFLIITPNAQAAQGSPALEREEPTYYNGKVLQDKGTHPKETKHIQHKEKALPSEIEHQNKAGLLIEDDPLTDKTYHQENPRKKETAFFNEDNIHNKTAFHIERSRHNSNKFRNKDGRLNVKTYHQEHTHKRKILFHSEEALLGTLANWVKLTYGRINPVEKYDVVVVGSEPEGIAAAIAAAREGQRTLLLDKKPKVGGLFTLGKLNMLDINWSQTGESLNQGLFLEFFQNINNRTSFDVEEAQRAFENMLAREKNITVELNVQAFLPIMNKNHVEALFYKNEHGELKKIIAKQFIDSTANADVAQLAGASFTIGQEDFRNEPKMMAVTLVFEVAGINWEKVKNYLNQDNDFYTGADNYSAWGYGSEMKKYKSLHENVRIRALNIGLQNNGHVLINAFQILGINGLKFGDLQAAKKIANEELPHIVKFLRDNLVGFENARLISLADEVYVRETRHLNAEYRLTVDDVLENRDFADRIAFGSYPIDMQATTIEEGDIIIGNPVQYAIPFRSIVPKGFDNLLVASRSAGYDSLAHGSARTVPIGMTVGQAAGVAAAYTNKQNIDFQTIIADKENRHIRRIQAILNENGANLKPILQHKNPIMDHWAYEGVKFLRRFALIAAGYDNKYNLETTISKGEFVNLVEKIAKYIETPSPIHFPFAENVYEQNVIVRDLLQFLRYNRLEVNSLSPTIKKELQSEGLEPTSIVSKALVYMFIKEFFELKNAT